MGLQTIINNLSVILMAVCAMCILISIITEFTKDIGFLKRIPTTLQVLVLSIIVCLLAFFALASYMNIVVLWYYIVVVIFAAFIVALITAKGWDYLIEIIRRYWRSKDDLMK